MGPHSLRAAAAERRYKCDRNGKHPCDNTMGKTRMRLTITLIVCRGGHETWNMATNEMNSLLAQPFQTFHRHICSKFYLKLTWLKTQAERGRGIHRRNTGTISAKESSHWIKFLSQRAKLPNSRTGQTNENFQEEARTSKSRWERTRWVG